MIILPFLFIYLDLLSSEHNQLYAKMSLKSTKSPIIFFVKLAIYK